MKNRFVVTEVERQSNDILCRYSVEGDPAWKNCFNPKETALQIHYSEPIADVPPGIAVIPLICDVLPVAWLFDAEIEVDELDEAFLNSIPEFKRGYEAMYPKLEFRGNVTVRNAVAHAHSAEKSAVFFSGGVDSTYSLIAHLSEKPALITLWGADVPWDNEAGWQPAKQLVEDAAARFGLPYHFVRSNLRKIVNEYYLTKYVSAIDKRFEWWCGFQHGIAMLGHAAPLALQYGIGKVYLASSYTAVDIGKFFCASDPTIDNHVRFGSAAVQHDAYDVNRQQKTGSICEFAAREGIGVPLRVCVRSKDVANCSACYKCRHTMMGILVAGGDPGQMGFEGYCDAMRKDMLRNMHKEYLESFGRRFPHIREDIRERYTLETCPPDLRWLYRGRFDRGMPGPLKLYYWCKKKLRQGWKRLLRAGSRRIRRLTRAKRSKAAHV